MVINDYEKVTNQYIRAARKLKGGDMSVTVPYIELGKETRKILGEASTDIGEDDTAASTTGSEHFGQSGTLFAELVPKG